MIWGLVDYSLDAPVFALKSKPLIIHEFLQLLGFYVPNQNFLRVPRGIISKIIMSNLSSLDRTKWFVHIKYKNIRITSRE